MTDDSREEELLAPVAKLVVSDMIEANTVEYGAHTIRNLFPSVVDGLKCVIKRILWAIDHVPNNDTKITASKTISATIEIHPYGDASIYQAIVRLSQPFKHVNPLLEIDGNCGTYAGDEPAAFRYTYFSMSKFAKDLFFDKIDERGLKKVLGEDQTTYEPMFLVPKLPFALLNSNCTPGYGYKSLTMSYRLDGVARIVMAYSKFAGNTELPSQVWDYASVIKHLVPHGPINGHLRNASSLHREYHKGHFTAKMIADGTIDVCPRDSAGIYPNSVDILTLPFDSEIEACRAKLLAEWGKKGSYFDQHLVNFEVLSSKAMEAKLRLTFKKSVDIFEATEVVKKLAGLTGFITPTNNYVVDDHVVQFNPMQIVRYWYRERYRALISRKKYQQHGLTRKLQEVLLKLIVCEDTKRVLQIIRGNDYDTGSKLLKEEFKLTEFQTLMLMRTPLHILTNTSRNELVKQKADLERENKALLQSYNKINEEIHDDAADMLSKYKVEGGLHIPQYLGYLKVGATGVVQYETKDELIDLVDRFEKHELHIHKYQKHDTIYTVMGVNNSGVYGNTAEADVLPKTMYAHGIHHARSERNLYTLLFKDGGVSCVQGKISKVVEGYRMVVVGKQVTTIDKSGKLKHTTVKDFSQRKSITRGATSPVIYAYDVSAKPRVLVTMNTKAPNQLRLQLITDKTNKAILTAQGKMRVLDVIKPEEHDELHLSLAEDCLNRTKLRHVVVTDYMDLFADGDYIVLDVTKGKVAGRRVRKHAKGSIITI